MMTVCYVFTGTVAARHWRELLVSATTVKEATGSRVVVVTSTESQAALNLPLDLGIIDEVIVKDTFQRDFVEASRFLKTSIGELVDPPFVFLDTDTFATPRLRDFSLPVGTISASANHSMRDRHAQSYLQDEEIIAKLKWTTRSDIYFNTGVIGFGSDFDAVEFSRKWHVRWKESSLITGIFVDQPSFNYMAFKFPSDFSILSEKMNAQISCAPWLATKAEIVHYYGSDEWRAMTSISVALKSIVPEHDVRMDSILLASKAINSEVLRFPSVFHHAAFEVLTALGCNSRNIVRLQLESRILDLLRFAASTVWHRR